MTWLERQQKKLNERRETQRRRMLSGGSNNGGGAENDLMRELKSSLQRARYLKPLMREHELTFLNMCQPRGIISVYYQSFQSNIMQFYKN